MEIKNTNIALSWHNYRGRSRISARVLATGLVLFLCAAAVWGFSRGPNDGLTGAPGETTCAGCHINLNNGSGQIIITAPAQFTPGETLTVTIQVQNTWQQRWGFEITALDTANMPTGHILVTDPARTQLSTDANLREYIKHTQLGTDLGTLNVSPGWTFSLVTSPNTTSPIVLYAAGLAANGNNSSSGDSVYTTSTQIQVVLPPCCVGMAGNADGSGDEAVDISDLQVYIDYLFFGGPSADCLAEFDLTSDSLVDISDLQVEIDFLFFGGSLPDCP